MAAPTGSAGYTVEQWAKNAAFIKMAWERVYTDRLNLEVAGVFNDTDKTMAIAATRVVEPEIRTLNRARAVQDLMSGNSCITDIGRFTAFMERFRNGPTRFDSPGQGEY
jgi:hypothetical protein